MALNIRMAYKLRMDTKWIILQPIPGEYFDPEEEEYEVDSATRFLDDRDYLKAHDNSLHERDIININIFIKDIDKNTERSVYHTYWNNGKNILTEIIERKDNVPLNNWHEIIIQLTIDHAICETLRFEEKFETNDV